MAYDRATLTTDATGYMHRADLPWDTFIDRANQRIGGDFRTTANTQSGALTSGSGYLLPGDFKEMISVQVLGPSGVYALQAVGPVEYLNTTSAVSPFPYGYWVRGGYLTLTPKTTVNVDIWYFAALALGTTGTSTNLLLETYPQAYLWYVLMLASLYIQDREAVGSYLDMYMADMQRANDVYRQRQQSISSVVPTTGTAVVST